MVGAICLTCVAVRFCGFFDKHDHMLLQVDIKEYTKIILIYVFRYYIDPENLKTLKMSSLEKLTFTQ